MWKWANTRHTLQLVLCKQLPSSLGFSATQTILLAQTDIQEAILKCYKLGDHTVHAMFYRKQMNPCFQQHNPTQITAWSFKWCSVILDNFSVCINNETLKGKRKKETSFKGQEINRKYWFGQETFNVSIHIGAHAVPVLCNYQKIGTVGMGENMKLEVPMMRDIMSKLVLFL